MNPGKRQRRLRRIVKRSEPRLSMRGEPT